MIDECGECIVSDFRAYYGVDLRDVLVPDSGLTPRLAIAYIRNLPPDSATVSAIKGGQHFRGWDVQTYLTASLIDAVRENTYVFVSANSKHKPKAPTPIERPAAREQRNPLASKFAAMARIAHSRSNRKKDANGSGASR